MLALTFIVKIFVKILFYLGTVVCYFLFVSRMVTSPCGEGLSGAFAGLLKLQQDESMFFGGIVHYAAAI